MADVWRKAKTAKNRKRTIARSKKRKLDHEEAQDAAGAEPAKDGD